MDSPLPDTLTGKVLVSRKLIKELKGTKLHFDKDFTRLFYLLNQLPEVE